jgi:hypothetical protein
MARAAVLSPSVSSMSALVASRSARYFHSSKSDIIKRLPFAQTAAMILPTDDMEIASSTGITARYHGQQGHSRWSFLLSPRYANTIRALVAARNHLRHVPVIVIGPRKPSVSWPGVRSCLSPLPQRGGTVLCARPRLALPRPAVPPALAYPRDSVSGERKNNGSSSWSGPLSGSISGCGIL